MRLLAMLTLLVLAAPARADWTLAFRTVTADLPGGAQFIEREARSGDRAVRVQGVFFEAKQARLAVIDNAARRSLGEAMAAVGALAGVNGGYFHPDDTPLGLAIAEGRHVHEFQRAKLLSGVFVVTKGRPRIVRSAQFTPSAGDTDALQAGPFLVEAGRPIPGLNAAKSARRTVIATNGAGRWAILSLSGCTLADAGAILASAPVWPDFRIAQALNLDGGSSSGLWVATAGKPFSLREFTTVRNFVAVLPLKANATR